MSFEEAILSVCLSLSKSRSNFEALSVVTCRSQMYEMQVGGIGEETPLKPDADCRFVVDRCVLRHITVERDSHLLTHVMDCLEAQRLMAYPKMECATQ